MKIYTLHSVADNGMSLNPRLFRKFISHVVQRGGFSPPDALLQPPIPDSAILTFDDCYADNFCNALPILREHAVKALFFFVPDYVGRVRWGSAVKGRWSDQRDEDFSIPFGFMDLTQIATLRAMGHAIGFHTRSHPNLPDCDAAQMEDEILTAKQEWEQRLGFSFDYFAYPRGRLNDDAVAIVSRAGYKCAFSTKPGEVDAAVFAAQRFTLPRLPIARKGLFGWA